MCLVTLVPQKILSDRGSEFESELFTELMRWMKIDKLRTTAHKPSTNGVVERFDLTLNSMLAKQASETQRDSHLWIPLVLAAYRATPHQSTGFSLNMLFLGQKTAKSKQFVMHADKLKLCYGETPTSWLLPSNLTAEFPYMTACQFEVRYR